MLVIEVFARGATPRHRPTAPTTVIRRDSSGARHNPENLVIALAGFRPATAEHAQIPSCRLKVRQIIMSDAIRRPFTSCFAIGQLAGALRSRSHTSPAALKSP